MVLKIVKVVESIDKTMRLQLKFVTRRHILAIRTRVLTFWILRSVFNPAFLPYVLLPSLLHFPSLYDPRASPRFAPLGKSG